MKKWFVATLASTLLMMVGGLAGCDSSESGDEPSAGVEESSQEQQPADRQKSGSSDVQGQASAGDQAKKKKDKKPLKERMHSLHEKLIDAYKRRRDSYDELMKATDKEKLKEYLKKTKKFHEKEVEMYSSKKGSDEGGEEASGDKEEKQGEGGGPKSAHVLKMAKKMFRTSEYHTAISKWAEKNGRDELAKYHDEMRKGYDKLAQMHDIKGKRLKKKERQNSE